MGSLRRLPLLARMAVRYARRHRAQTTRAVLGLVVVALVLTTGLGLGDSIGGSLERSITAQYGPVDVIVRGAGPFGAALADGLPNAPAAQALGVDGGATLVVIGAVSNPRTERAEAFAQVRGVSPQEPQRLGPLPDGAEEPAAGEVVLGRALAKRLDARVGDELRFRVPLPGLNGTLPRLVFANYSGIANVPGVPGATPSYQTTFAVDEGALGILALIRWDTNAAGLTATARSPTGKVHSNQSAASPLALRIDGPLETGAWSFEVTGSLPIQFRATITIVYPPASLLSGFGSLEARVSAIIPDEGRAAASFRPVALVTLGDLQRSLGLAGQATHGYYSTQGDPDETVRALRDALRNASFEVQAVKANAVARAETASGNITGFILVMGGFTMVASMLLAYALFSALVEERRIELGIARALGLTRREVAATMVLEGLLYAVAAALVGVLLGLLLLQGMLVGIDAVSRGEGGPRFTLMLEADTLPTAFLGGVLLPLATIAGGSLRFAGLDPARAIRGAPDDLRLRRRAHLVGGVVVALVGVAFLFDPLARLLGIPILASGLGILVWGPRRRALAVGTVLAGVAYAFWSLYAFDAFPDDGPLDPLFTMARGLVLALALAALVVVSPAPYRFLGRLLGTTRRLGRSAYVAFRYLAARRRAAGLTTAMIAVVGVVVTVMGTLALVFSNTISGHEAGYEVLGDSPIPLEGFPRPLEPDLAAAVERADFVPTHREVQPPLVLMEGRPHPDSRWWRTFAGVTPEFAEANEYVLAQRSDRYASDREAWRAVARGEALVAPIWFFGAGELEPGMTVRIDTVLGPSRDYHVAGAARDSRDQIFVGPERLAEMGFPQGTMVYVRIQDGADPNGLAARLTEEFGPDGLVFLSVPQEARRAATIIQATILVFESFLALGVFVGIAATSFLATRAVHERLRDIGTMRALGYEAPDVRRAFILESTLVAFLGLAVGLAVGLVVAHSIWYRSIEEQGVPFLLPWPVMLGFAAAVLGLAALAARRPARRAARLDPAAALRHVE